MKRNFILFANFLLVLSFFLIAPADAASSGVAAQKPPPAQRSLHYVFMGVPCYGHIKPTLEIVDALTKRGHRVTYFNVPKFKNKIEEAGATFVDYNTISFRNPQPVNAKSMDLLWTYQGLNTVMRELWPTLLEFQKYNHIDVIVYDQFAVWGKLLARQHNIPSVCSSSMLLRTPEEWGMLATKIPSHFSYQEMFNCFSYQEMLNCFSCLEADKVLAYTSADFQPEIKERNNIVFFGNRLNKKTASSPQMFDQNALVYISFGTEYNCDVATLGTLIDFFKNTPHQVIISTGGNEDVYNILLKKNAPKNIHIHKWVDQKDVLSKASLFITHAGMNSVYEAINWSVPMIMIPQMEEQRFNAHKVRKLGLGYVLDSKDPSQENIKEAMETITQNWQKYRDASSHLNKTFLNSFNAEAASHAIEVDE